MPSGGVPLAHESQAQRRQAHSRRSALHPHQCSRRSPCPDPRGLGHRVPRRADQLRNQLAALEHGSLLQRVRGQLHERGHDHQRRLQGYRRPRGSVLGPQGVQGARLLARERQPRRVRQRQLGVQTWAEGAGPGHERPDRQARRSAIRRPGPLAQAGARRARRDPPEPALRVPDPEAALQPLHAGNGGASLRLTEREIHQGRRGAAREFRPRPHQRVRVRGRVDPAHLRRPDDRLLRVAPAPARQHWTTGRRRDGAARPRRDPGLDRRAHAVPQHPRLPERSLGAPPA